MNPAADVLFSSKTHHHDPHYMKHSISVANIKKSSEKILLGFPSTFILSIASSDGVCCHEIKRRLLLGRKAVTNLDSILKSRDTTLPAKVRLVKAVVSPVVMSGCESWTIKKTEHRRIDVFELCCWRRLSRLQGDQTSPSPKKSVLNIHWED